MATEVVKEHKWKLTPLDVQFKIKMVSGPPLVIDFGCKDCKIKIGGRGLTTDLMMLDMNNFKVILGMNWLSKYHVYMDCKAKILDFSTENDCDFSVYGLPHRKANVISVIRYHHLLNQGCTTFIVSIFAITKELPKLEYVSIVSKFSNIFSEELPGLPL